MFEEKSYCESESLSRPVKISQTQETMDFLEREINYFGEQLEVLAARLKPVLIMREKSGDASKNPEVELAQLPAAIRDKAKRLQSYNSLLSIVIDGIEL